MRLENVLVHLDSGAQCASRLELAVELAQRHEARLVGLFAAPGRPHSVGVVATWPSESYRAAAAASREAFRAATLGLGQAEWRDANRGAEREVIHAVVEQARRFDLVVLGQHAGDPGEAPAALAEEVAVKAGRPALVVPYAGTFIAPGRRPIFAWDASREAARALNDALPLVAGCEQAWLLSLERDQWPLDDLVAHLARHGVAAQAEELFVQGIDTVDAVLNRGSDLGADLLVMGAHAPQVLLPLSAERRTRHILARMTMPVLLSA